ncbi:MAG: M24 family metallopeptidase [Acidobacteriaceae bacterium]
MNNPTVPIIARQDKLAAILQATGLDSLIVNAGPSLTYLTGLNFHLSERPVLVFFMPGREPMIVLPELEKEKLKDLPFTVRAFLYGDDPSRWGIAFAQAISAGKLDGKRIGFEPRQLRLLEYRFLLEGTQKADFISAENVVSTLRMRKDDGEIKAMRQAAEIAERALNATLPSIKVGTSEREVAIELSLQLLRAGCDPQFPFAPIVSAGPNSANPHATPSDRKIAAGDLLVIDWGTSFGGYCSDITRTFSFGEIETKFKHIAKVVLEANTAGRKATRPGIPAEMVDNAARSVIDAAGYGTFFTHRTGHGLGMEAHEEPYIRAGNPLLLENGMTFTIEPGIYLPERNGVRIEDDMVITELGADSLTSLPREVKQLA